MIFIRHSIISTTCLKLMPSLLPSSCHGISINSFDQGIGISTLMIKTDLWRVPYLFLGVLLNYAWRFLLCRCRQSIVNSGWHFAITRRCHLIW
jgi:hypothetical protein